MRRATARKPKTRRSSRSNRNADALAAFDEERFWRGTDFYFHTTSGERVTPDSAVRLSTVLACVRVLSETLAVMPCKIYRYTETGRQIALDHPLYQVMHKTPNRWQTAFEFFEMMMVHLLLRGNAYALITPGPRGAVDQLEPIHPDRVKVERIENGRLRYTVTDANGKQTPFSQDDVFHVRGMSYDGVLGMSPIQVAANTVGLAMATETHGASLFRNGGIPGIVFSTDRPMAPAQAKQITDAWNRQHGGAEHHNKPAILPFGLKPTPIGLTNRDAEFIETRKLQRDDICAIFRVPPHLAGSMEHATFSNIEHQSLEFITFTMLPWVERWEQAICRDLIPEEEYFAEFSVDAFLRGDSSSRASFYREMIHAGIMTVNDARKLENLDPIGEPGDKHIFPSNFTTLDKIGEEPEPQPTPFGGGDSGGSETDDEPEEDEANSVIRGMLLDTVRRLARMEADSIERLKDNREALEEWYNKHSMRLAAAIVSPLRYFTKTDIAAIDFTAAYKAARLAGEPFSNIEEDAVKRMESFLEGAACGNRLPSKVA